MQTAMTTDEITTIVEANKGELATVLLTDGSTLTGELISINSKGINVKDAEGKTISRGLARVQWVEIEGDEMDEDTEADYMADMQEAGEIDFDDEDTDAETNTEMDALVAELDGATTAELADVFGMAAKELRVVLRELGMGVGKGHRYHLTAEQIGVVKVRLAR